MAPFFAQVQVVSALPYLGLVLGPAADANSCWLAPSLKVKLRSRLVGNSPLAVSTPATNFTTGIAPVPPSVAQFRTLPQRLLRGELIALSRTFSGPFGCLEHRDLAAALWR
eukprot:5458895-Pyramimonas_sp.AAC.1